MSKVHILGMRGSTCTRRALLTLEEMGTPYEFELVNIFKGDSKTPDYLLNKHPWGKVPVLKDGDLQIYESRAIIRYLAQVYDKTGKLYPADPKARAMVEQWINVEQYYFESADQLVGQLIFGPMEGKKPDDAKVQEADKKLNHTLEVLNRQLGKTPYLAGDNFTLADVCYLPYGNLLLKIPQYANIFDKYPNVAKWWKLISSRPAWQKVNSQSEF